MSESQQALKVQQITRKSAGCGLTALGISIASALCAEFLKTPIAQHTPIVFFIPFLCAAMSLSILGIIYGLISLFRLRRLSQLSSSRTMAIVGLTTSAVAMALAILLIGLFVSNILKSKHAAEQIRELVRQKQPPRICIPDMRQLHLPMLIIPPQPG